MNETALITGASSGIGLRYAEQLAAKGYDLVIVSNEDDKNRALADFLSARYSVTIYPVFKDLCSDSAARELYEFCREKGLQIEILINNAGMLVFDTLSRTPIEKIDRIISLHVKTATILCKLFSEQMKQRGSGRILIMSSATAHMPYPTISVYAATKSAALQSFRRHPLDTPPARYNDVAGKNSKGSSQGYVQRQKELYPGIFHPLRIGCRSSGA